MTTTPEIARLLDRVRAAVNEDHRRRRRRRVTAVAAAALLGVGGAAIAAVTEAPWWQDAAPPVNPRIVDRQLKDLDDLPAGADRSRARTVAEVEGAALVAVPLGQTGYCVIPSLPGSPDIGFSCQFQAADELRSYAQSRSRGVPRWILYGRIVDARAAALDLSTAAGVRFRVPLKRGGFFLADVPQSRWAALSGGAGEGQIVDASGGTLRTGCVNWGPSPESSAAGRARYPFWRDGSGECRAEPVPSLPTVDLSRAQKLVELRLTRDFSIWKSGTTIALWRAPASGLECVYVAAASPAPSGKSQGPPSGPGSCGMPVDERRAAAAHPFDSVSFSSGGLLTGHVDPASGIARVDLHSGDGSRVLAFDNDYFLGQLPDDGSGRSGSVVVGVGRAGEEVARVDLDELRARATPH